jgi:hypothetical protein
MRSTRVVLTTLVAWLVSTPAGAQEPTRNPHGKLAEECAVCHSAEGWVPARITSKFDHAKKGFALAGAHATTACRSCHVSLDFHGAARDCASCHKDAHHGELGVDCARCHTPRSFIDRSAMARAHQLTRFPLTGSHLTLDCEACHTPSPQGRLAFVNVSVQCVECHLPQYQAAKSPDHAGGGFPQDCSQCHATTVWTNARFNHDVTGFSLTGAHRAVACAQCHVGGVYAGIATTCVSCHQPDYNGTTNPSHAAAGFPTTCETCHMTAGWTGAAFNHTWFALPHGTARVCSDCHTDPSTFALFTCTTCHTQATTDPHHSGVRGYIWNSTNCYACHRNGRGG